LYQTDKVINPLSISRYTRIQYITSIGLFYKNVGILVGGCLTGGQSDWASRHKFD